MTAPACDSPALPAAVALVRDYLSSPPAGPLAEAARLGNLLAGLRRLGLPAVAAACRALPVPGGARDLGDGEGPLVVWDKLEQWLRRERGRHRELRRTA